MAVFASGPQSAAEVVRVPAQSSDSPGSSAPSVAPPAGVRSASWGSLTRMSATGTAASPALVTVIR